MIAPVAVFDRALQLVLRHEGGLVDNPKDPGGLTKFGISQRAYPQLDIRGLTVADAADIYRKDYWDKIHGDDLPEPLAIVLFDTAVNVGWPRAILMLQESLGVTVDGNIGPQTLAACAKPEALVWFSAARVRFYVANRNYSVFGLGWIRRTISTALEANA
jgi:lysozyme family protein